MALILRPEATPLVSYTDAVSPVTRPSVAHPTLAIIGGGPAGLMAAESAAGAGFGVDLYDAMPSVGRKFLLAGKGGLNLTHAEPMEAFLNRYGARRDDLEACLRAFDATAIRAWAAGLGVETFAGSSQRIFPVEMKAAPLLRAWLRRLRGLGVRFHGRHRWRGWTETGDLCFDTPVGAMTLRPTSLILALGGGSWARLGSDGAWQPWLRGQGITVHPLKPANCGFDTGWSPYFAERFAGAPIKPVVAEMTNGEGHPLRRRGELVLTRTGLEGSLIYALSAPLRDAIERDGPTQLRLDLAPDRDESRLRESLKQPRAGRSLSRTLRRAAGLSPAKIGLLREVLDSAMLQDSERLAAAIKSLPIGILAPRPLDEAISSAGGVAFEALDERFMLRERPGVFCAGEMLDWEAPTGGYLLSACLATGRAAGLGAVNWLRPMA